MENCYEWDKNQLKFIDINKNSYNFKFRGNKTIVCGESSTGKTLMCTIISSYIEDNNTGLKPYNTDNIFVVNRYNKDKLKEQKGKFIIIDRAEMLLDDNDVNTINSDRGLNRYLIFCRKALGIEVSPNHYANIVKNNKSLELYYPLTIRGCS